jgi:hypothetical protein
MIEIGRLKDWKIGKLEDWKIALEVDGWSLAI